MPNKIRYLFGPPIVTGAKARKALEKALADFRNSVGSASFFKDLKTGRDWKTLSDNFLVLKKAGYLSKGHYFKVWRERTHVRENNSRYRQLLAECFPKPKAGAWMFDYGNWYNHTTAWAIPLLEAAGFGIKHHSEGEDAWRIWKLPNKYPFTYAQIIDKKVLNVKALAKKAKASTVTQAQPTLQLG